jgi:thiamine biosynthesis protein ThiS
MKITLNGKSFECEDSVSSLAELLSSLKLNVEQVVVEHNGTAVARERLMNTALVETDSVEIIHFVGGG